MGRVHSRRRAATAALARPQGVSKAVRVRLSPSKNQGFPTMGRVHSRRCAATAALARPQGVSKAARVRLSPSKNQGFPTIGRVHSRRRAATAALARPQGVSKAARVRLGNVFYFQFLLYRQTMSPDGRHVYFSGHFKNPLHGKKWLRTRRNL